MTGIELQSVSIGMGIVHWRVVYPHLARRNRNLQREYADLEHACTDLKQFLTEDQVDAKTVALIEERVPEGAWGAEAESEAGTAT